MSRIAIIGAGIGGMCTAARLASLGHKVDIFENSNVVGGKCRTEWIENLAFDTGPTLLTLPAVFRDFFLKTGDPIESVLKLTPVNPSFDYQFFDGSRILFPNLSRYETLQSIRESIGDKAAHDWAQIMLRASDIWDASRKPFIESELDSFYSLLKSPSLLKNLKTIAPWQTLRSLVAQYSKDYHLQYIVDRYATYSGSDPRKAPAALLSIAYVEESFGAWHISGGVGQLAVAIRDRAIERGVNFHFNSRVAIIAHNESRVSGIILEDGKKHSTDIVVSNADSRSLYHSLLTGHEKVLNKPRKALKKATPSVAGFSMFFEAKSDEFSESLNHHTILFPSDYDKEFDSLFNHHRPATEPTIYICSPRDAAMSKLPERYGISILVNVPRHSTDQDGWNWENRDFVANYTDSIIALMESREMPVRHNWRLLATRTPIDLEKSALAPGGSIYGTSSNGARAAFSRTRNRSPLSGLFCVGGSTHPGGGLPLVAISAEIVSNMIGKP